MQVRRWDHPHNDYLRVFHDQGLAGLVLFLTAWALLVLRFWRGWREADSLETGRGRRQGAALLLAAGILASFLTDNTLVYIFVMGPAFILFSVADFAAKDEAGGKAPIVRNQSRALM
jgi:O-antigen ligase